MTQKVSPELAKKLTQIATRQIEAAVKYRRPRLDSILKNFEAYDLKPKPTLKGRIYIPLPIVSGFADTLKAKLDDPPRLTFGNQGLANLKLAQKVTASWELDSHPNRGNWPYKDRANKTLAIFTGRGIFKIYSDSLNGYTNHLEVVDPFDFLCEPKGGGDLENHLFLGQQNIYRTEDEIVSGVKEGVYDLDNATILIRKMPEEKTVDQETEQKQRVYRQLGLDQVQNSYIGQKVGNLTEWYMKFGGEWYYLFFEPISGLYLRVEPLKELYDKATRPFVSWATHEDPFNFWSKAPIDDIRPVAEGMEITFNEGLNNLRKRNWSMRAYDPSVFPDPSQLEWSRPDQLVQGNSKMGERALASGVYEFQTPDNTTITVNLFNFLDNFLGKQSGVTPSAQGMAGKDTKVGVYYGDMAQVSDRLGLLNKSYSEAQSKLGQLYVDGLRENLTEPVAVKMIGTSGVEWDELKSSELKGVEDFDITASGSSNEAQANEVKRKQRYEALIAVIKDPRLSAKLSDKWIVEQMLTNGGWEAEAIKQGMNLGYAGSMEELSVADRAVEEILKGKKPKEYRGATTAFIQYILDYATDNNVKDESYTALIAYANGHFKYAKENAVRNARLINNQRIMANMAAPVAPMGVKAGMREQVNPVGNPASDSQQTSNAMTP